jgi:hypothetical protein
MDGNELRKVLLEVVAEHEGSYTLQAGAVITEAARQLNPGHGIEGAN